MANGDIESLYGLLVDPEFSQLPPEEQYKGRQYIFRELSGKDPEFRKLPVEERRKVLFPIEEEKPSIMEPIEGTAKAIPEAVVGLGKAAYEIGKTIVSPPPVAVRPTETLEEAKARRLGLVGRAALRGATLGLMGEEKEPLLPEEERLAQAAEFITAAVPFGAAIKTGERLAKLARLPQILGAAAGGGAAASVAAPPGEGLQQFGAGAGVVGTLSGAFGLAGRLFQRLKGREPSSRAEVIEAIREEPAFIKELAKDPEFIQVTEAAKVSPKDLVEFIRQPQDMPLPEKAGVMVGERRGLPALGETYTPPPETIPEGKQGKLSLTGTAPKTAPETTIPPEAGGEAVPEAESPAEAQKRADVSQKLTPAELASEANSRIRGLVNEGFNQEAVDAQARVRAAKGDKTELASIIDILDRRLEQIAATKVAPPTDISLTKEAAPPEPPSEGGAKAPRQRLEDSEVAPSTKKIDGLTETPAQLEYKGKTYEKAIKTEEGIKLIDDKDVVLKKATDILPIEEKVPFEVPGEKGMPPAGAEVAGQEEVSPEIPSVTAKQAKGILGGERGSIELPTSAEMKEHFDVALEPISKFRRTFQHLVKSYDIRNAMTYTKSAGENAATLFSRQMSNDIRGPLRRAYGEQAPLAEQALSFVIESKGEPTQLDAFRQKILDSDKSSPYWKRISSQAIDFARANWKRLDELAKRYGEITDQEISAENANGIPTAYRPGYVMHVHDLGETVGYLTEGRGEPTGFRHIRQHETLADAIAAGLDPKTLNSVDLLQSRLNRGQRMVNNRLWINSLRDMSDPTTGKSIISEPTIEKRANGSVDVRPPDGYSLERIGFQPVAVQNGYEGIFGALTDPSAFDRTMAGRGFMQAVANGKSITLLFDTFHLGRVAFWDSLLKSLGIKTFKLPFPSYGKGITLMDYTPAEIERMAQAGEIPQRWLSGLQEGLHKTDLAVKSGYNIGRISDALYQDAIHNIKGIGTYNKWLFDQFQRGAMREVWSLEFDRLSQARPELSEMDIARKVSRDLNTRFGNLGREGIFKSRTAQDMARAFVLAPQWNEGLIRSEIGAVKQLGELGLDLATGKGIYSGVLLRSVGGMAVLQFAANQLINYYTRGHPTWENPEEGMGAKISAWVPDLIGEGPGFFLHPLGLAAETTHLLMQSYEKTDDSYRSLKTYLRSRASVAMRPALTFITNQDFLGRTLKPGTVWSEIVKSAIPAPIGGSAAYSAAKEIATGEASETFPGQYQKQLMASAGVKTEQAPSPSQRISQLAREFNTAKGVTPSAEFFVGDYQPLTQALQLNNRTDAKTALDELLKTKTVNQIIKHYKEWPNHPFTGQKIRERAFFRDLSYEQRGQYKEARLDRFAVARKAFSLLAEAPRRSQFHVASGERAIGISP